METMKRSKVSEAARTLGKLGGMKGGKARAEALTSEQRQTIAREAIATRWERERERAGQGKILKATHGSPDRPLRIGPVEIPCYVLEDGKRVIIQGGMLNALDMGRGGPGKARGDRLANFINGKSITPFIPRSLGDATTAPMLFRVPNGKMAYGYEATVLADICDAVLEARKAGALRKQQEHIAARCEILVRGFARVGIIALVDEATGYQEDRDREDLHKILEAYISKELLPWAKRFPDEFYEQMFRLRGWQYHPMTKRGPRKAGELTSQIVYEKLPPHILEELRNKNPIVRNGRRQYRHHQFLTTEIGHPHLQKHLISVITLMRASTTWKDFEVLLERVFPSHDKAVQLVLELQQEGHYQIAEQ